MRKTDLRALVMATAVLWIAMPALAGKPKSSVPAVRWAEETPGCTFARGDDGMYRWGLWTTELGITIAVDSQELEKARKRIGGVFGVLVTVKYRGSGSVVADMNNMGLEFVEHSHVTQTSIDPDGFAKRMQADADELEHQTGRTLKKHPEKKQEQEAAVQAYLKDSTEFQEFLSKNAFRETKLDSGNPTVAGWVFFSTRNKWIGDWKKREDFIFRMPLEKQVFEFPFSLPPTQGDLILRKRP